MKRSVAPRKKIRIPTELLIPMGIMGIFALILVPVIFFAEGERRQQEFIDRERTTTLNVFRRPHVIEAVLSEVTDENGDVLVNEERIRIEWNKVKDVEYDGNILVVDLRYETDARLPNVTLAEWREATVAFDSPGTD